MTWVVVRHLEVTLVTMTKQHRSRFRNRRTWETIVPKGLKRARNRELIKGSARAVGGHRIPSDTGKNQGNFAPDHIFRSQLRAKRPEFFNGPSKKFPVLGN